MTGVSRVSWGAQLLAQASVKREEQPNKGEAPIPDIQLAQGDKTEDTAQQLERLLRELPPPETDKLRAEYKKTRIEAYRSMAMAYIYQEKFNEAIEEYEKALAELESGISFESLPLTKPLNKFIEGSNGKFGYVDIFGGLLTVRGKMTEEERENLSAIFPAGEQNLAVKRLYEESQDPTLPEFIRGKLSLEIRLDKAKAMSWAKKDYKGVESELKEIIKTAPVIMYDAGKFLALEAYFALAEHYRINGYRDKAESTLREICDVYLGWELSPNWEKAIDHLKTRIEKGYQGDDLDSKTMSWDGSESFDLVMRILVSQALIWSDASRHKLAKELIDYVLLICPRNLEARKAKAKIEMQFRK